MADSPSQPASVDITYLCRALTVTDITSLVAKSAPDHRPRRIKVNKFTTRNKKELLKALLEDDPYWGEELQKIAVDNVEQRRRSKRDIWRQCAKRTRDTKREQAQEEQSRGEFLDLPSDPELLRSYTGWHNATTNAALEHRICAVCARLRLAVEAQFTRIKFIDLPNRHRLVPHAPHPDHFLVEGCLLEPNGCHGSPCDPLVDVCKQCLDALQSPKDLPPKFSLANNLWLGEIPWELARLTFAEHLLIARNFPRMFLINLFPRDRTKGNLPRDQVQTGLRGNVVSFELNSAAIADMIAGNLMPQPPEVLASTLSVTFIGRGKIRDPATLNMLRVRRSALEDALKWLQTNNKKYYGDIVIDRGRLNALPTDGLPDAIGAGIRYDSNESNENHEYNGYVPESYYNDNADMEGVSHIDDNSVQEDDGDPDVIPLQYLGVMDNDLSKVSSDEMMRWGFQNIQQRAESSGDELGYAIRHGAPVRTFGQPLRGQAPADPARRNYWEAAFPILFPRGIGGLESDRPCQLSLNDQARWSLEYYDRRFRYHHSYIFAVFGEQQKRQGLLASKIRMKHRNFEQIAQTLSTITPADLRRAAQEESRGEKVSNPAIELLKRNVTATSRRVMGSGPNRTQLRSQIYSAAIYFNQPTIWLTINPDDLHDPIAQIFACEEIDMDNFIRTAGPDSVRRSQNIARDPYAAAKFFNFTITLVLEKLFGITTSRTQVTAQNGVLGKVKAYFGTVECQGRGTLHLHMLIWLHNVPPPRRLKEIPGLENKEAVEKVPAQTDIAYSRSPNPSLPAPQFVAQLEALETHVVRNKQVHKCDFGKCLRVDKLGKVTCKRGAPWQLSDKDSIDPDGTYHTKRTNRHINGYCPAIAHTLKCNQDIQLLLHGNETLHIAHYISKYMTKPEGRTHNMSNLLADNLTRHFKEDPKFKNYLDRQQELIFRGVNIMNNQQEISAPLAVLHIMGDHDVFRSHYPEYIFWGSFVSYIYRTFTELNPETSTEQFIQTGINDQDPSNPAAVVSDDLLGIPHQSDTAENEEQDQGETVTLDFNDRGVIYRRSQVDNYMFRGGAASPYNVLDYFVDTYEQLSTKSPQESLSVENPNFPLDDAEHDELFRQTTTKRSVHTRVEYMDTHPQCRTHIRVIRPPTHNHMPNIIGPRFPRSDDPTRADLYAACILAFLKPWRSPTDIKRPNQTWQEALSEFLATASDRVLDIIDNLQHKHESQAAAESRQQVSFEPEDETHLEHDMMDIDQLEPATDTMQPYHLGSRLEITQEMLDQAEFEMENYREVVHGIQAVRIAQHKGVFSAQQMPVRTSDERASETDKAMLKSWLKLLKQDVASIAASKTSTDTQVLSPDDIGTVEPLLPDSSYLYPTHRDEGSRQTHGEPSQALPDYGLFPDQQRAFDIMLRHITQTLYAETHDPSRIPPQLRMMLIGEGGTGKSRVIQAISREFKRLGIEDWLVKAAFTGSAASHIEGQTTHSAAKILVGKRNDVISFASRQEMANTWKPVQYLIIDEYSMLSKEFLAQLSRHVAIAKLGRNPENGDLPFGGINVILCGDGHQIPPVAVAAGGALHHPATTLRYKTTPEAGLGRKIYEGFNRVVILKQQVRVTDPVWQQFLSRFRVGQVQERDLKLLHSVTLTNRDCRPTDFTSNKWLNCVLITPRNAVQVRWNSKSIEEHCRRTGEQLLIVKAYDTCMDQGERRPISNNERYFSMKNAASSRNPRKGRREKNGLPDEVRIAIGMKVMVTRNLNTDIDITNGARGEIVGIKLDPAEPAFSPTAPEVTLTLLPTCVLVKLDRTRAHTLPGLQPRVIPIVPVMRNYSITVPMFLGAGRDAPITRSVKRLQFPLAPAYAFTDYRAQGQTLKSAIIDIAEPPTGGKLSQPNIYVALSRCSGLEDVRILRDFDCALMKKPIDADLVKDDERLEQLNRLTQQWWDNLNCVSNPCAESNHTERF